MKHRYTLSLAGLAGGVLAVAVSCTEPAPAPAYPIDTWEPSVVYRTTRTPTARGLLDRRGLIHAHSYYSHDACDGEPVDENGVRDEECFDDFRRGICQVQHDFVFLTDHGDSFADHEYPDVLLYREARGDTLVERDGAPVANWAGCQDGSRTLVMAGTETGTMPVGLERHVAPPGERGAIIGARDAESIAVLKEAGAVVLVPHTEDYTPEELIDLPLDGFEMFNLHANSFLGAGKALELMIRVGQEDEGLPHPDASFLAVISEDPRYLETWGTVLARGAKRVTTMGTDCHRNSFPAIMPDGERVDSYRRMMLWFSNHLLVRPDEDGSWDDRHLKEALRSGRLYGAFEIMGYPLGFDFRADAGGEVAEMGEEVALSDAPTLFVKRPSVQYLDPAAEPPQLTVRVLKAREGGWDEVASADEGDLSFTPDEPGAYRAEVRMIPFHLRDYLGDDQYVVLERDAPWVYSNPIYVR